MPLSCLKLVKRNNNNNIRPDVLPIVIFNSYVCDRSGSMTTYGSSIMNETKKYIVESKKTGAHTSSYLTLITFDDEYTIYLDNVNIKKLMIPDDKTLLKWTEPRGGTRLIDTIIFALEKQEKDINEYYESLPKETRNLVNKSDIKKILTIFTDGNDNSSTRSKYELHNIMDKYKKSLGLAIFMGANQDAINSGNQFGFSQNTSITVGTDSKSAKNAFGAALPLLRQYSSGGVSCRQVSFTPQDRALSNGNTTIPLSQAATYDSEDEDIITPPLSPVNLFPPLPKLVRVNSKRY